MKRLLLIITIVLVPLSVKAQSSGNAGWHFPIALTYASGFNDVTDAVLGDFTGSKKWNIPAGLSFSPYRQFANGLGVGLEAGPFMVIIVEVKRSGYGSSTSETSTGVLLPLGVFARYDFVQDGPVSPYVRAGVRECFVSGDIFDKSAVGFYGNIGVEFSHSRKVRFGLEAGFDTTKIKVYQYNSFGELTARTKEVKPYNFTISAYVSF